MEDELEAEPVEEPEDHREDDKNGDVEKLAEAQYEVDGDLVMPMVANVFEGDGDTDMVADLDKERELVMQNDVLDDTDTLTLRVGDELWTVAEGGALVESVTELEEHGDADAERVSDTDPLSVGEAHSDDSGRQLGKHKSKHCIGIAAADA